MICKDCQKNDCVNCPNDEFNKWGAERYPGWESIKGTGLHEIARKSFYSKKNRSDKELIEQTNELANKMLNTLGYKCQNEIFKFYKSNILRARLAWNLACLAQEFLTDTDIENALANLEE